MNDQDLLEKLREGDDAAFKKIFSKYFGKMKFFALEYVEDPEDAVDIAQNVFATLWEKHASLTDGTCFFSLLLCMTKNQCIDFIRKKQMRDKFIQHNQELWEERMNLNLYALENFDVKQLSLEELQQDIQNAIDTLPDNNRETFVLSRQEGLKYAEIAEKLEISIKTVEKRMSASLKHLREKLKEYVA